jgi:hypothetical protein
MVLELDILIVNFFQLILPALAQPINPLGGSERQNQLKSNFFGVWRAPSQHFDVESTPPALTIIPMPTSNINRTAERLPLRPLAPAEQLQSRPLALNDSHLSSPSVQQYNNYTPRVEVSHSHPPHHEERRGQSPSLHPYSGEDSDSYGLMTPISATTSNKTTKSSSTLSNHNNYLSISSPPSHHLHHQGYGGATSTFSSHSINNIEECVESILAFLSPLPILSKVPGLTYIQVGGRAPGMAIF